MSVFFIAALGVLLVLTLILVVRLHPLIALLTGALVLLIATPENIRRRLDVAEQTRTIVEVDREQIALREQVADGRYVAWPAGAADRQPQAVELQAVNLRTDSIPESTEGLFWYRLSSESLTMQPNALERGSLAPAAAFEETGGQRFRQLGSELTYGFSKTFSRLGIPVTMAAIVGICLLESGAAARLVFFITGFFGPRGTAPAMTVSSFLLGVPVYFDNVFYLLLPLAKAIGRKRAELFLSSVMAIIVGATMAHSLVPPTPGPLLVASLMEVSVLEMMIGGLCVGGAAACVGFLYGRVCQGWVNFTDEQLRKSLAQEAPSSQSSSSAQDEALAEKRKNIPILLAVVPIGLPILLLAASESAIYMLKTADPTSRIAMFLTPYEDILLAAKNPSLVFIVTAIVAIAILRRYVTRHHASQSVSKAITDGGMIVLLTCAGGAFGYSLQQLDLAGAISSSFSGVAGPWALLCTAFFLTTIIRAAQGSATVAMVTSASIISPVLTPDLVLPFDRIYLALAIGCGSKPLPWMNDSGFWQVATMTGMTPVQTLKSFSVALTLMGLTGFLVTLLGAYFLPLV